KRANGLGAGSFATLVDPRETEPSSGVFAPDRVLRLRPSVPARSRHQIAEIKALSGEARKFTSWEVTSAAPGAGATGALRATAGPKGACLALPRPGLLPTWAQLPRLPDQRRAQQNVQSRTCAGSSLSEGTGAS